jgi:hypothetical protein
LIICTDKRLSLDLPRLRNIVIGEFARRPHHTSWPPIFTLPTDWREELARDARQIQFEFTDPDELARHFIRFIAEIEGIIVKPTHEYRFLSLQTNPTTGDPGESQSQQEMQSLVRDGWRAVSIGPRPGYGENFLAILERTLDEQVR